MSSPWLDMKYINLLSFRLRNFKRKSDTVTNFSCPICDDSKTNKRKARGFVYFDRGKYRYCCHNCNVVGYDVARLVKYIDPNLYNEYLKESLQDNPRAKSDSELFADKMKPPVFQSSSPLKHLQKISSLADTHPAKKWVNNRLIPADYHYKLYFCRKFVAWVTKFVIADKFSSAAIDHDEPRLIIPFLNRDKRLIGFQGRSFDTRSQAKYITIMVEDTPKIFGVDQLDDTQDIYVFEGPINSMFVTNSIAIAGGSLTSNLDTISTDKSKFIVVYDNDPRNEQIVNNVRKAIANQYRVCIWPHIVKEHQDINDLVLDRWSPSKIKQTIDSNTFSGLEAQLKWSQWKKV